MTRNKLYLITLTATISGYLYIFYKLYFFQNQTIDFCIIKNVTGFPCPSCGTTRAIILLVKAKFVESILVNPFGLLLAFAMLIFPFWIIYDLIKNKNTFYYWYCQFENKLRNKKIAIPLIILVLLNWIWNIYKEL